MSLAIGLGISMAFLSGNVVASTSVFDITFDGTFA